jgi:stage II sporulation protein M
MPMEATDPPGAPNAAPAPVRPPGPLRRLYHEEAQAWRDRYRRYFKYAARALGLGFVAGFLYFVIWPAQEKKALDFVVQALKDIPFDEGPALMALTLFYHNARASIVAAAAGVVPFLFLPIFDPLLNGGVLGLLVSMARHQRLDVPLLVLTQILPHGVFELTAVLYATAVGLYVSAAMGRKVTAAWRARRENRLGTAPISPPESATGTELGKPVSGEAGIFRDVVRSFALVILPLLLIAAFIEAFLTPHLR